MCIRDRARSSLDLPNEIWYASCIIFHWICQLDRFLNPGHAVQFTRIGHYAFLLPLLGGLEAAYDVHLRLIRKARSGLTISE